MAASLPRGVETAGACQASELGRQAGRHSWRREPSARRVGGGERVTDAGSPTAARGREGVLERWVGALQRSLCCDCVALKGWIEVVTSVARCYMQKAPTRERKTPVRGDELTSRATSSESQRREARSKAVFKFLLLSLAAAGYCTAHFTLLSNFRGGGRTNDKMHKKKYLPP